MDEYDTQGKLPAPGEGFSSPSTACSVIRVAGEAPDPEEPLPDGAVDALAPQVPRLHSQLPQNPS